MCISYGTFFFYINCQNVILGFATYWRIEMEKRLLYCFIVSKEDVLRAAQPTLVSSSDTQGPVGGEWCVRWL